MSSTHPTLALQRARATDALKARNISQLRTLLEDGATFASFTIQQATERAEIEFDRWISAGRPADVRTSGRQYLWQAANRRLASVRALTDAQVLELATVGSPRAEQLFAQLTWGYGPAKASFALACAGFGRQGCIDGRLTQKHRTRLDALAHNLGARDWQTGLTRNLRWDLYQVALKDLWPGDDSATGQWSEWLEDLAAERYRTDHAGALTRGHAPGPDA